MPYWVFLILAITIHLVVNFDTLRRKGSEKIIALREYKIFLSSVLAFYITDLLWGIFDANKMALAAYIDTVVYFVLMGATIYLWTRFVVTFLESKKRVKIIFECVGLGFFVAEIILIIINIFKPILFEIKMDTAEYISHRVRDIMLWVQIAMYFATFLYALIVAIRTKSKLRRRYFAVSSFSIICALLIFAQTFNPLIPFYSMAILTGICVIHAFLVNDIRCEFTDKIIQSKLEEVAHKQALDSALQLAYTDSLTNTKSKYAYVEMEESIDKEIANNSIGEFGIVVFDLNGLKGINDELGHDAGDKYIVNAVKIIKEYFGEEELYRFGGDEFVLILKGDKYKNRVRLLADFNVRIEKAKGYDPVISAGMSAYRKGVDNTFRAVFNRADKIMYGRKDSLKERGYR